MARCLLRGSRCRCTGRATTVRKCEARRPDPGPPFSHSTFDIIRVRPLRISPLPAHQTRPHPRTATPRPPTTAASLPVRKAPNVRAIRAYRRNIAQKYRNSRWLAEMLGPPAAIIMRPDTLIPFTFIAYFITTVKFRGVEISKLTKLAW